METITYAQPMLTASSIIPKTFNNPFMADIYFSIEKKLIYSHKFVLMARSGFFHKHLSLNSCDKKQVMVIKDYTYEIFYQFVKYIYTDKCTLHSFDIAFSLLQLSIAYEIVSLENLIIANLTTRTLITAERLRLFQFRESQTEDEYIRYAWIQDCVAPYVDEVFESNILLKLPSTAMENILKWNFIGRKEKHYREFDIFNYFFKWLVEYCEKNAIKMSGRRRLFDRLKCWLRFPAMPEFEFLQCMKQCNLILGAGEFYYVPRMDYTMFQSLENTVDRKHYAKSNECKWLARCYAADDDLPKYLSPIGTKLIAFQITSYFPIWSVTLRIEPPNDLRFPMIFTFKDNQCRKFISLGDSVRIHQNYNYFVHIHVIKEGRIIDGHTEDITNTGEKPFYTKRSIIHGYEIETFFRK